jgi:hypothetical protein
MNTKKYYFFSIVLISCCMTTNYCPADITSPSFEQKETTFDEKAFEDLNKKNPSVIQTKLEKFNQAALDCEQALLKAQKECKNAGNCDTCKIFQNLSAQKSIFDAKIYLLNKAQKLHDEGQKFGIMNLINLQITFRRIIDR